MKSLFRILILVAAAIVGTSQAVAWMNMPMPELHVDGRYLKDPNGNIVNLHGFAMTFSPWFNEQGTQWSNYDVNACLAYNQTKINQILNAGWDVNFVRMHMDPYWSNKPGVSVDGEGDISAFDFERFKTYLDLVFIPMAEYAVSKGLYVVMRPPGVCPENIEVGGAYHEYLLKVWTYVAQQPRLRNHPNIMFELANEPINIKGTNGQYGNNGASCFAALKDFFQQIVNAMRQQGAHNVLWVPGLCWQMHYSGYANNPIEGVNIGYAVHLYPGWFGSSSSFTDFQNGWNVDVKPVADIAPIMVTEMDWADEKYNCSWGKAHTGQPYGEGNDNFGANFKIIMDNSGNCSWLLFTGAEHLARFVDQPGTPGGYTFLNDPEACPWPVYHWYQDYRAQHDYPYEDFTRILTSDDGTGYFNNPVIYGDFPDVDVIRVDDTYYMMSTTMFFFPGATIMRSYDLVNWEYCANPLDYIELDDAYTLANGQNRYSRGMWASAFQYNPQTGKFYILINTLNEGAYLLTAENVEGPWTKQRLNASYYDCGLLFDGDDTYIAHGNTNISITKVDQNFRPVETHQVVTGDPDNPVEGSRLYHIGDYYYIYAPYCSYPGKQTCFRSKSIFGPYEETKRIYDDRTIHQGALFDTKDGKWYTMLHRDYYGGARVPYLIPVTFNGGWPRIALSVPNIDKLPKPIATATHLTPRIATNDLFRHYALGKQWQWNHVPDASKWSLIERADFLRLYTASVTTDWYKARNTITQRIIGYHAEPTKNYGTVAIDISHMKDGDRAGLAIFQDPLAGIGVKMVGSKKVIYYHTSSLTGKVAATERDGAEISGNMVYLRAVVDLANTNADFYWSTDNQNFTKFGDTFSMPYDLSVFVGNRYAIYNYATKALGGYVDVDWFSTEPEFSQDVFGPAEFGSYDRESLTIQSLEADIDRLVMMTGTTANVKVMATFEDGHTEEVGARSSFRISNSAAVNISSGLIKAIADGTSQIEVVYTDPFGGTRSTSFTVEVTTFPLLAEFFNPSIFGNGSFNEATRTVTTGQWGFAGWRYPAGVNLSGYKHLVAKVAKSPMADGLSFRVFDASYWDGACETPKRSGSGYDYFDIELATARKTDNTPLATEHVTIAGFWSHGNQPFVIREVYVTNDDDFLNPASAKVVIYDANDIVDVYNTQGMIILSGVTRADAKAQLPAGLYIIGGEKVLIRR